MVASFVGTWRLVSYTAIDPDGSTRPVWDDQPIGQLVYTSDGYMSAQVYSGTRKPLRVDAGSASAEIVKPLFVRSIAYFGLYSIDTMTKRVTHSVQGSLIPDWIGTQQKRAYRFIGHDCLELSVPGFALLWERVRK